MGQVVDRLPHSCGTKKGLVVFANEAGEVDGHCFSCGKSVQNPYGTPKKLEDLPKPRLKSAEEIELEIAEIKGYPTVDLPTRKLRKDNLEKFGVKVALSERDGTTPETMFFPVTREGALVGYKAKTLNLEGGNKSWQVGDTKNADLFNWENAKKSGAYRLIITEGECFLPDTEVLTEGGWVSFEALQDQKVGQVVEGGGIEWVKPLAYVDKHYEGDLIEYKSGSYYSLTTEGHNLVREYKGGWIKCRADDSAQKHKNIPRVFDASSPSERSLLSLQIWIMLSADFSFRKEGDIYGVLKKVRKIERAKKLLNASGVRYHCAVDGRGYTSFFIHRGHGLEAQKLLPKDMFSHPEKHALLTEVIFWDGNLVKGKHQWEFSSKLRHNAESVQLLSHSCGYVSTIIPRKNDFGEWFKVSVLLKKTSSSTQKGFKRVEYSGRVMCVTVPSGMIVVRQNGSVSISGNCDAVAVDRIYELYGKDEYHPAIVSVPYGAGQAHKSVQKHLADIRRLFREVVICFDNDERGQEGAKRVSLILPEAKNAILPAKDANDCIKEGLAKAAFKALQWDVTGVKLSSLVFGEAVHEAAKTAASYGELSWPFPSLNKKLRGIRYGETIYVGAGVKCGKSELLNELAAHFIQVHDVKVMMAKPEEDNKKTYKLLAGKIVGKRFHDPDVEFDEEAYDEAGKILEGKLAMVDIYQNLDWNTLKDYINEAALWGAKAIFIDPITVITNGVSAAEANTMLQDMAQNLAAMAKDLNVVIFIFCHLKANDGNISKDQRVKKYHEGKYWDLGMCPHEMGGTIASNQFAGSRAMMR